MEGSQSHSGACWCTGNGLAICLCCNAPPVEFNYSVKPHKFIWITKHKFNFITPVLSLCKKDDKLLPNSFLHQLQS